MKINHSNENFEIKAWVGMRFMQFVEQNKCLSLKTEAYELQAKEIFLQAQAQVAQDLMKSKLPTDVAKASTSYVCKAGGWVKRDTIQFKDADVTHFDKDGIREHIAKTEARNAKTSSRMREMLTAIK